MKLIVGLGNYPRKYTKTRHNVGFLFVDWFCNKHKGSSWSKKKELEGLIAEVFIDGEKVILLKPTTFMNLSGTSVSKVMAYFDIETEDFCVVFDDIDMEYGKVRFRENGSSGGHNGVKSLQKVLGSDAFKRIKIGVGNEHRKLAPAEDFVLQKFTKDEYKGLDEVFVKAEQVLFEKGL